MFPTSEYSYLESMIGPRSFFPYKLCSTLRVLGGSSYYRNYRAFPCANCLVSILSINHSQETVLRKNLLSNHCPLLPVASVSEWVVILSLHFPLVSASTKQKNMPRIFTFQFSLMSTLLCFVPLFLLKSKKFTRIRLGVTPLFYCPLSQ